jgi:hypothetical protein
MLKKILVVMGLMVSLTLVGLLGRGRSPEPLMEPVRPDLRPWDFLGCLDVSLDPWTLEFATQETDSVAGSSTDLAESEELFATDTPAPAILSPPGRLMLLPDSLDEWGRPRPTYRAVPLDADYDGRLGRFLQWFVRADTLWLLWSDGVARGGTALFASGDSLVGRARALDTAEFLDGTAWATAWPVNCATLERESRRGRPRR